MDDSVGIMATYQANHNYLGSATRAVAAGVDGPTSTVVRVQQNSHTRSSAPTAGKPVWPNTVRSPRQAAMILKRF